MSFDVPKNRNEARRIVYETLIVVREQLNKALGCRIRGGDLEFLTKAIMDKLDKKYYGRKPPKKKK
jgi:hypothetical protein